MIGEKDKEEELKGESGPGLAMGQGDGESSDEEITTKQPVKESSSEPVSKSSSEAAEEGATSPSEESSTNSWWSTGSSAWSGWYESALNKSSAAYDLMKKDLSEFKDTIASESVNYINSTSNVMSSTVQVVSSTANYLKETVESLVDDEKDENESKDEEAQVEKKSDQESSEEYHYPESLTIAAADKLTSVFNTLLESILPTGPADDPDEDCVLLPGNYLVPKARWDQLVQSIQSDPITYCHEPTGPPDDYETWLEKFNLMDHESSINYLLQTSPTVADFYSQFVPKSLSSDEFWHRYFYRLHQLQEMEIQRAKLLYEKSAIKSEECDAPKDVKTEDPKSASDEASEKVEEPTMKKCESKSNVKANLESKTKKPESKPNVQVNLESKDVAKEVSTPKSSPKKTPVKVHSKLGQASKVPSSASSVKSSASSIKSGKGEKRVSKVTGKTPSPASSESTAKSSSEGSEWEKTDLNEIVDEVAKKLGDKLNSMPEPRSDEEELDQWEFE